MENLVKGPTYSARDVHLRVESRKSSYQAGDSINLRLTLRNVTDHDVTWGAKPDPLMALVTVVDSDGQEVKPTLVPSMPPGGGGLASLGAGQELTLKSSKGKEWMNLRDWGYDLRTPGTYTISGVPTIGGPKLTADVKTKRANDVRITIKK
jgi:hypothetical protein